MLIIVAVAVVVGLLLLWPTHTLHQPNQVMTVSGKVRSSTALNCGAAGTICGTRVGIALTSGPDRGGKTSLTFTSGPTDPKLRVGDGVRLGRLEQGGQVVYQFADIARGRPLLILTLLFVAIVIGVGRVRGLAALIGLAFAGAVLVSFVLPALLDGRSPTLVALIAGAAITLIVLPLSHGVSLSTGVAMIGTLAGMLTAAGLAAIAVPALRITGLSGEESATLALLGSRSTVGGLLLAGSVIGALGVLNDVTVTQVAAVTELGDGGAGRGPAFRAAMRIGQDHIASTVYSLVLAYAGSALPLLLLFSLGRQSTLDVLTSDSLAPEIAASLIGGISLVLVVPVTTAAAVALIPRLDSSATPMG